MEEFKKEKTFGKEAIVLFYADWCPFCRAFMPIFKSYEKSHGLVFLGADISDENDKFWDEYSIKVVPTLARIRRGKIIERRDAKPGIGLTEEDLSSFVK